MRLRLPFTAVAGTVLVLSVAGTSLAASAGAGSSLGLFNAHVMAAKGAGHHGPPSRSPNLSFHGGSVQIGTQVYVSYWGSEWSSGGSPSGQPYSYAQAQAYLTGSSGFFPNVGGSSWINSDTQYCQNVPSGTTNCSGISGAQYVTNPSDQYGNSWNDTTSVPAKPTQSQIFDAAVRLANHFGGYSPNNTYLVFTPSGKSMSGFGTSWCAWHSSGTGSVGGVSVRVAYGYIPYMPDAGYSCGMNFINSNNSFGNGYFDGFSVVAGHEYEEAQTDPFPSSGWLDGSGAEDADKCAWSGSSGNITLGSNHFAVQPLWSNASSGCVMSY
jgi:hypothetical protein